MASPETSAELATAHFSSMAGNIGFIHVLLLLLFAGISWLIVDYMRMLLLRTKMVSVDRLKPVAGPFPYPIIGNTFMLPEKKPWIYFEQLGKEYNSGIIDFWIGRNPTVWLNDAQTPSDLLDKRAANFSSRPRMIVFGELAFGQASLVTMKYGDRFREHRKLTHMRVDMQHVRGYQNLQSDGNKVVLYDFLTHSENYVAHFERYETCVMSIIGYGRRISTVTDPIITEVIYLMQKAAEHNVAGKTFPMLMETFRRGYMTFGWGRVCAGQALTEQGTFISIARLLWAFNIQKALDENGREIPVDIFDYTDGLNIRPKPFKCRITPRSEEIRRTIETEGKQAQEDLAIYNGEMKYRITTYRTRE